MILNIGEDRYLLKEDLICIVSSDSVAKSDSLKDFIAANLNLDCIDLEKVESFILIDRDGSVEVETSSVSSKTLEQRYNLNRWR